MRAPATQISCQIRVLTRWSVFQLCAASAQTDDGTHSALSTPVIAGTFYSAILHDTIQTAILSSHQTNTKMRTTSRQWRRIHTQTYGWNVRELLLVSVLWRADEIHRTAQTADICRRPAEPPISERALHLQAPDEPSERSWRAMAKGADHNCPGKTALRQASRRLDLCACSSGSYGRRATWQLSCNQYTTARCERRFAVSTTQ